MVNEFSVLNTGYSKYGKEVMQRLHATGKYELAELSCYASQSEPKDIERAASIPWKMYFNGPNKNKEEELREYDSNPINAFGEWKFEKVCLDFKPNIVFDIRDFWMMDFEERSPFRRLYSWAIMPAVDSEPQNEQWLATFANADAVFTYSDWGASVLRQQGGGKINVIGSAPPSSSDAAYYPVDKKIAKSYIGLGEDIKIVGTVMRNQRRKLYPDLFDSFRQFLDKTGRKNVYLYCHTSYPDVGWDIPYYLKYFGIGSKTLFTYLCRKCRHAFPTFFGDTIIPCIKCGAPAAGLSNVQNGVSEKILAHIMNMFDVYVQYANSEGFGVPQVEAAACGTPVMSVDYSAMGDVVRKLNGFPLRVSEYIWEPETGCKRAKPDNQVLAQELERFFDMSDEQQLELGKKAREGFETNYQWDETARKWERCFDSFPSANLWTLPPRIAHPSENVPNNVSNQEFARWLIKDVLCEPERLGTYMELRLIRDLNNGVTLGGTGGMFFNENSQAYIKPKFTEFGRKEAYEHMVSMCKRRNFWEKKRVS